MLHTMSLKVYYIFFFLKKKTYKLWLNLSTECEENSSEVMTSMFYVAEISGKVDANQLALARPSLKLAV